MKKILILMIAFSMLLSPNVFAGASTDNLTPKNEISDVRNSKKIKTIQKLLNTKVGKWIVKKTIKKLQRQALKPQKSKNKKDISTGAIFITIFSLILLGGIVLIFSGYVTLGVILAVIGLLLLALSFFIVEFFNFDNWKRATS